MNYGSTFGSYSLSPLFVVISQTLRDKGNLEIVLELIPY